MKRPRLSMPATVGLAAGTIWTVFFITVGLASGGTPLAIPVIIGCSIVGALIGLWIGPRLLRLILRNPPNR